MSFLSISINILQNLCLSTLLIEEFKDQVPDSMSFQSEYFEGSQQAKISLVTDENLKRLYDIHKTGEQINMWCEGMSNESANKGQSGSKRK